MKNPINFKDAGTLLFPLWGWIMCIYYLIFYFSYAQGTSFFMKEYIEFFSYFITIFGAAVTIYYLYKHILIFRTPTARTVLTIWISLLVCMVFTNVMLFNVIHEFKPELQHPIFMLLTGFSIVATGSVIRKRRIIVGGILFAVLAFFSSYVILRNQLLMESLAWFLSFVIPGHLLNWKSGK
jgi:hypothetical protein